jgi:polyisoprenyl-phosphate glycosyltransferase
VAKARPAVKSRGPARPLVEIVVPVYNEAAVVHAFHEQLTGATKDLPWRLRVTFVDDGSTDGTDERLASLAETDPRVRWVRLSRNFGHQAALTAGLDLADADAVITMDGDGEHPPELIGEMLSLYSAGYDVVLGARQSDRGASPFKAASRRVFYRLLAALSDTAVVGGVADFRLLSRRALDGLRQMREYHRYLRGMVNWVGFRTVVLPYQPASRLAGSSKYSLRKMIRLAVEAIFSFSLVPLYLGLAAGAALFGLGFLEVVYVAAKWILGSGSDLVPGWSSLMFMLLIVGSLLMFAVSIVGIYVGMVYQQVKGRPVYIVETRGGESRETGRKRAARERER